MKKRIESQGIHFFDRVSGTHILFDEIKTSPETWSLVPRTVSIGITDKCDLSCSHCHVPKYGRSLSHEQVLHLCLELDKRGTFDIAIGGGEPLLHPDLISICHDVWNQTQLGLSLTTNGFSITEELIDALVGKVGFFRISVDGPEPFFSLMRHRSLDDLLWRVRLLKSKIPFGFNVVLDSNNIVSLDEMLDLALKEGASELLLLPKIANDRYVLESEGWSFLSAWIDKHHERIPLRIISGIRERLKVPFLFDDPFYEMDYAYVGPDYTLRRSSYTQNGLDIASFASIDDLFSAFTTLSH